MLFLYFKFYLNFFFIILVVQTRYSCGFFKWENERGANERKANGDAGNADLTRK